MMMRCCCASAITNIALLLAALVLLLLPAAEAGSYVIRSHDGDTTKKRSHKTFLATTTTPFESPMYDEQHPRRRRVFRRNFGGGGDDDDDDDKRHNQRIASSQQQWSITDDDVDPWGIERLQRGRSCQQQQQDDDDNNMLIFPHTVEAVAEASLQAIAGTIYQQEKLDPNVVQNAVLGANLLGRRPVRRAWDAGRIGIELDGVSSLFLGGRRRRAQQQQTMWNTEHSAIRRFALILAGKLSQRPWVGFETNDSSESDAVLESSKDDKMTSKTNRPVAVYFNTIKQALMASRELSLLKRAELENENDAWRRNHYTNVTILCLEDDDIPENMQQQKKRARRRPKGRYSGYSETFSGSVVDATRGLVLIVQPTDYNDEYRPPGPAIGSLAALQRLVARASVEKLPTVLVSPRLTCMVGSNCWDQSGYQQSATYGGSEPPRGPTPWIMRDFTPPSFCWVGNALSLPRSQIFRDAMGNHCRYLNLSIIQSVMHEKHPWHVFAAKECSSNSLLDYEYIASTKSSSGRPTRDLLHHLFQEFATYC